MVWYRARMRATLTVSINAAFCDALIVAAILAGVWIFFQGVNCGKMAALESAYKIVKRHGVRD